MTTTTNLRRLTNQIHFFSKDLPSSATSDSIFEDHVEPFLERVPDDVVNQLLEDPEIIPNLVYEQNPLSGTNPDRVADLYTTFYRNQQALFFKHEEDNSHNDIASFSQKLIDVSGGDANKIRLIDDETVAYANGSVIMQVEDELVQSDLFNDVSRNVIVNFGVDASGITKSFKQRLVNHSLNMRDNAQLTQDVVVEDGVTIQYDVSFNTHILFPAEASKQQISVSVNDSSEARKLGWTDINVANQLQTYYDVSYNPAGIVTDGSGATTNVNYGVYKFHFNDASSNVATYLFDQSNNSIAVANYSKLPIYDASNGEVPLNQVPSTFMGVSGEFLALNEPKIADDFEVSVYIGKHSDLAGVETNLKGDSSLENGGYTLQRLFSGDVSGLTLDASLLKESQMYVDSGARNNNIIIDISSNKFNLDATNNNPLEVYDNSGLRFVYERNEKLTDTNDAYKSNIQVGIDGTTLSRMRWSIFNTPDTDIATKLSYNEQTPNSGMFTSKVIYHSDIDSNRNDLDGTNYLQGNDLTDASANHTFSLWFPETNHAGRSNLQRTSRNSTFRVYNNGAELHYDNSGNGVIPSFTFTPDNNIHVAMMKVESTVHLTDESPLYDVSGLVVGELDIVNNTDTRLMSEINGNNITDLKAFEDVKVDFQVNDISGVLASNFHTDLSGNAVLVSSSDTKYVNYDNGLVSSGVKSLFGASGEINSKIYWMAESTNPSHVLEHKPRKVVFDMSGQKLILNPSDFNESLDILSTVQSVPTTYLSSGSDLSGTFPSNLWKLARLTKTVNTYTYDRFVVPASIPGLTNDVKLDIKNLKAVVTLYSIEYNKDINGAGVWMQQSPLELSSWSLNNLPIKHTRSMSFSASSGVNNETVVSGVGSDNLQNINLNIKFNNVAFASMTATAKKLVGGNWTTLNSIQIDHRDDSTSFNFILTTGNLHLKMYAGLDLELTSNAQYSQNLNVNEIGNNVLLTGKIYDYSNELEKAPRNAFESYEVTRSLSNLDSTGATVVRNVNVSYSLTDSSSSPYSSSTSNQVTYTIEDPSSTFKAVVQSNVFFLTNMLIYFVRHPVVKYDDKLQFLPIDNTYHNLIDADGNVSKGIMFRIGKFNADYTQYFHVSSLSAAYNNYYLNLTTNKITISHYGVVTSIPGVGQISMPTITVSQKDITTNFTYYPTNGVQTWGVTSGYYRGYKTQTSIYRRSPTSIRVSVNSINKGTFSQTFTNIWNNKEITLNNLRSADNSLIDLNLKLTVPFSQLLWSADQLSTPHKNYEITMSSADITFKVSNPNYHLGLFTLGTATHIVNDASNNPIEVYYRSNLKDFLDSSSNTISIANALRLKADRMVLQSQNYNDGPMHLKYKYNQADLQVDLSAFGANVVDVADITTAVASRTYNLVQLYDQASFRADGTRINNIFTIHRDFSRNFNVQSFTCYVTCAPPQYSVSLFKHDQIVPFNRNTTSKINFYNIVPQNSNAIGTDSFFGETCSVASAVHKAEPRITVQRLNNMIQTPLELRGSEDDKKKVIKMKENKIRIVEKRENDGNEIQVWEGYLSGIKNSDGLRLRDSVDDKSLYEANNELTNNSWQPGYPVRIMDGIANTFQFKFKQILSEVINLSGINVSGVTNEIDIYNIKLQIDNVMVYGLNKNNADDYLWNNLVSATRENNTFANFSGLSSNGTNNEGIFLIDGIYFYKFDLSPEKSVRPWFYFQKDNQTKYRVKCQNLTVQSAEDEVQGIPNVQLYLSFSPTTQLEVWNTSSWEPVNQADTIYNLVTKDNLSLEFKIDSSSSTWNNLLDRILPTPRTNKLLLIHAEDIMEVKDAAGNTLFVINSAGQVSTHSVNLVSQQVYSLVNGMDTLNPSLISQHNVVNTFSHLANHVSS